MHARLAEITDVLEQTRRDLLAAVPSRLAPADLARRPASGAWSVAEVLDHLAAVERGVARLVETSITRAGPDGLPRETRGESVASSLDVLAIRDRAARLEAPESVRPRVGVGGAEARAAIDSSRQALRAAIARADGMDLSAIVFPHPVLGRIDLYQWLLFVAHHEARHTPQVVEAGAITGTTGEWRVQPAER